MTHELPGVDDDELRRSVYWYGRAWHHRELAAQPGVIYWLELHACVSPGRFRPVPEAGEAVVDALLSGRPPPGEASEDDELEALKASLSKIAFHRDNAARAGDRYWLLMRDRLREVTFRSLPHFTAAKLNYVQMDPRAAPGERGALLIESVISLTQTYEWGYATRVDGASESSAQKYELCRRLHVYSRVSSILLDRWKEERSGGYPDW